MSPVPIDLCATCPHEWIRHVYHLSGSGAGEPCVDCECIDFVPREAPRIGVALILQRHEQVLFGLRKGPHGGGTWSVPGGHLEWGEEPVDCARRELLEECGLSVGRIVVYEPLPFSSTVFPSGKHYITLYMCAQHIGIVEPQVKEPDKCERWEWHSYDDLPSPLFPAIDPKKLGWS